MHVTETMIRPDTGHRLFVRYCHALGGSTSRTLVLLHGACEHGERYLNFARWMTQRRWNVILPDFRGHGRSGGVRTFVRDFSEYVSDVETVRTHFQLAPEQTALFGHSMGGLVTVRHSQKFLGHFAAVALSSPLLALKVAVPVTKVAVGRMVSLVAPQTRFKTEVNPYDATRNPDARDIRLHDPLSVRTITAGWYFSMKRALREAWADAPLFAHPLLILQAGQDRIVDPEAPARWMERIASTDARLHRRDEDYHELLNEPGWEETAQVLAEWLTRRLEAPAVVPFANAA